MFRLSASTMSVRLSLLQSHGRVLNPGILSTRLLSLPVEFSGPPREHGRSLTTNVATASSTKTSPAISKEFNDTKIAYASKSNVDLIRGLFVLLACQEFLVRRAEQLLG